MIKVQILEKYFPKFPSEKKKNTQVVFSNICMQM